MKTEDIDEAILASLKKLGPSAPRRLADDAGIEPGAVTYAGVRLRKAKLIQTAGSTANRIWALPEQKIELADLLPANRKAKKAKAAAKPKKTARRTLAKKASKSGAAGRAAANARRAKGGRIRTAAERRTIERPRGVARPVFSAADRATLPLALAVDGTFSRLRIALEEHLAAVTEAHQKLFGAALSHLATT